MEDYGISTKSIIANPGSYVYFSPKRRVAGTLDQFDIPVGCVEYNEYSYGLDDLYIYLERSGDQQMKDWYGSREVVYLYGEQDNDPDASTLPSSCRARLQGNHRLEKGKIYFNHMIDTFGEEIKETQRMIIVPDVGHNNFDIYHSAEGLKELFDTPFLNNCNQQTTATVEKSVHNITVYPNPSQDHLYLQNSDAQSRAYHLRIFDQFGNLQISKPMTSQDVKLDISPLPSGMYILELNYTDHQEMHKVIKL